MGSIDLNIIQRGLTDGFVWSASKGKITTADLGRIGETRTDNSGAMNALPTPFARFFVFKEAFRRVLDEKQHPKDSKRQAGRAYQQLVSNTLDVFELLYNKKWHENNWKSSGRKIIIKEWNFEDNLPDLRKNVPILGSAVESYFSDDLGMTSSRLFFIFLEDGGKDYLLATSSPLTGFITPPDMDLIAHGKDWKDSSFSGQFYKQLDRCPIKRRHGGNYFKDIVLFEERDADFKNYMYNKLFANGASLDWRLNDLRNYVQSFASDADISGKWYDADLKPVFSEDNNKLEINGLQICVSEKDVVNYFADVLVKIPYAVNGDRFLTLTVNGGKNYDYMIPLSEEGLKKLHSGDFEFVCNEKSSTVEVVLKTGGRQYSQVYYFEAGNGRPRVLDMCRCKVNLSLSIFPNVLAPEKSLNNWFKVMLAASDENANKTFSVRDINLEFFAFDENGGFEEITETSDKSALYGVKTPVVRSEQDMDVTCGTKYYEVFNSCFDAIKVNMDIEGGKSSFVLFPKWDKAKSSQKAYTYAVDLGTSNTYVSRREKGKYVEPQQLTMANVISSGLQAFVADRQRSLVSSIEDSYPKVFSEQILTEFVPPIIDGTEYKFPIRTALCVKPESSSPSLFDNSNIAFFYEKHKCPSNHIIKANVKWADDENLLRVFIREILLLIKADILQENGSLSDTEIIWFRPLSFKVATKDTFARIWREEASDILKLTDADSQIKCYTESEAPYYYFDTKGTFANRNFVAVLDIGGGTADVVYYADGKPEIANSVRFGCDVLWGDGLSKMTNSRENGIYTYYKDKVTFSGNQSLKAVYDSMTAQSSEASSCDIINFWLNSSESLDVSTKFKSDFLPVFAYHYVAMMYYTMSMFKANGLSCPKTLIFSGNGSRYIDSYVTDDLNLLNEMTRCVVSSVYGSCDDSIEVILPKYRKECTCYGGLYHRDGFGEPKPVVYVGAPGYLKFENVAGLKVAYESGMKDEIVKEVKKMNSVFGDVMKLLISKSASEPFNMDKVEQTVNNVVTDALESNYQKEVKDVFSDYEAFNDSLFFYPVIKGVFELTKICPEAKNRK